MATLRTALRLSTRYAYVRSIIPIRLQAPRFGSLFSQMCYKAENRDQQFVRWQTPRQPIFMWVENIFNRIDHARLNAVGPERACTEFVLRMGGAVKLTPFKKDHVDESDWIQKDTELPKHERDSNIHLSAVDMRDSTLTPIGMEHFRNLPHLKFLDLSGSKYVTDEGLQSLLEGSLGLRKLNVSGCPGVTKAGIDRLKARIPSLEVIAD